jgi:hypothetical protein
MNYEVVDTLISPEGRLEVLSKAEVAKLLDTSQGGLYHIFRKCALAVLNCGSSIDDGKELLERYSRISRSASSSASAASSSISAARRRSLSSTAR